MAVPIEDATERLEWIKNHPDIFRVSRMDVAPLKARDIGFRYVYTILNLPEHEMFSLFV